MGNTSSRTVSEMGISAKVNLSNGVSQSMNCDSLNINDISNNAQHSRCGGGFTQTIKGITATNTGSCTATADLISLNNQAASQDLQNDLTQVAESTSKGIGGGSTSATTESNTQISGEVNQSNTVAQKCYADSLNINRLVNTMNHMDVAGDCEQVISDVTLSNKFSSISTCGLHSTNEQSSDQVMKNTVSQSATAVSEGVDLWALAGVIIAIGLCAIMLSFAGPAAVTGLAGGVVMTVIKIVVFILKIICGFVLPFLIAATIYQLYEEAGKLKSATPVEIESFEVPWLVQIVLKIKDLDPYHDTEKYLEKMQVQNWYPSGDPGLPSTDGLYIVRYSSVYFMDPAHMGDRAELMKMGLQNEKLYPQWAKNNKAKEDSDYNTANPNPTSETAEAHLKLHDNYYAFEIIYYAVDLAGNTHELDKPITMFYTSLDENLWNYDLISKPECLEDNSLTQTVSCGIKTDIEKVQCNGDDAQCKDGEFCGLGNTGCISCEYCRYKQDGWGACEPTSPTDHKCNDRHDERGCLERCEGKGLVLERTSLNQKLKECNICKGRVLQQSEIFSQDRHLIILGNEGWNKVQYDKNYLKSDIWNEQNNPGNIRYHADNTGDGGFQKWSGSQWAEMDTADIGYDPNTLTDGSILALDSVSNDVGSDYIKFATSGTATGVDKCVLQEIKYTGPPPPAPSPQIPEVLTKKYILDPGVNGGYSPTPSGATCYDGEDIKCIDKYEAMCINFKNRHKIGGPVHSCDGNQTIDLFKTLVGPDATSTDLRCADISLNDEISADEWADCKSTCCRIPDRTESEDDMSFPNQAFCTHIPADSIKIEPRYLPYNSNVVGIRMYRDFRNMETDKTSAKDFVRDSGNMITGLIGMTLLATFVGIAYGFHKWPSSEDGVAEDSG